jgi:hypothetical protein
MDVPDDMDSDEELPYTVSVPGVIIAIPPFTTEELEDEASLNAFGLNLWCNILPRTLLSTKPHKGISATMT